MFTAARKSMPAIDYVSIVRSVYKDRRGMVFGTLASALGAGAAAYKTDSLVLYGVAAVFVLVTIFRYADMTQFNVSNLEATDVETAAKWEVRATFWGAFVALLYGGWCFCSLVFVNDPIAELISLLTTIAAMVGIVTRNFGLDRLLTLQLAIACTLLSAGLLLKGGLYHPIIAAMLLPMLIAMRYLAADVRNVLLSAVHGRVEASRLAGELDAALDTMQHGLCMLDENGLITVVNDRAQKGFAGFPVGEWVGRPFLELVEAAAHAGTIPQTAADRLFDIIKDQYAGKVHKVQMSLPGQQHYELTVSSRQSRTVLLFEDITERVEAEERINFMAHYDALTNLPNRGYFTDQVQTNLAHRKLGRVEDLAMLMIIDIDDFKHVNDTMGHQVGDRLLIEAAHRLRLALGSNSLIARLGGDEFIVYRNGMSSVENAMADANAVLGAFKPPFSVLGQHFSSNVSIGIVTSRHRDDDLDALMTKADLALYKSKGNGKAQSQIFHEEMDVAYRYRQRLKGELRTCVEAEGLTLAYQPVIHLETRRVVGCEALARWHHPELGTIPPSTFIPIAEEMGLISDISRWVLRTATMECRNWPEEVRVAVNISARDFRGGDLVGMVADALAESGLAPHRLEIEVTETAVIEERDAANSILTKLAKQGIGIALDDFGTGYSSLSYLQALPFTKLKIDRSFVADIATNPRSLKLLSNVAQLGRDINLTVTAEGVETEEQLALIAQHTKVDQIQGYLFGIPLPRRDVGELIARLAATWREAERTANKVNVA
ncbi:MAG: diguanylate cyclase [Hyphomicrobiales bacterium]|nr:diguanylate cyclase [Hyphomicrobiales bacterium]